VPENRQEVTTEGGLDVAGRGEAVAAATARLQQAGIEVSAFVDPEPAQVAAAKACGADAVELHTGRYANARGAREVDEAVGQIAGAVEAALAQDLVVHGGHGLTYRNIHRIAAIPGFCEFNIGHSIVSRALMVGLAEAVREMKRLIDRAAGGASSSDER
jgi:pyridoxine 5-phosphate synthase